MINLNYLTNHTLYPIFKITLTDNPLIKIYINTVEKRITFKLKTGYYLKYLMPETVTLRGSIKNKITKDKNDELLGQLVNY